jgi:hypothetical protein
MTIMVGANSVTSAVPIGSTPPMPIAGGSMIPLIFQCRLFSITPWLNRAATP